MRIPKTPEASAQMKRKHRSFISNLETTEPEFKKEVSDGRKQLQIWSALKTHRHTPPKFNIAPEKKWLEDHFPIGAR